MNELPHWKDCVSKFLAAGFAPGTEVPHEWFHEKLCIPIPQDHTPYGVAKDAQLKYLADMQKVIEELLVEHQIALRSKPGFGYTYVHPKDQARWGYDKTVSAISKNMRKGVQRIVHTDTARLTAEESAAHANTLAKTAQLQSLLSRKPLRMGS